MITGPYFLVIGFVLGVLATLYLGSKWRKLKSRFSPKGAAKNAAGKVRDQARSKGGLFARAGEYLATKPVEWLMGGKPGKKDKPDPDGDKEKP